MLCKYLFSLEAIRFARLNVARLPYGQYRNFVFEPFAFLFNQKHMMDTKFHATFPLHVLSMRVIWDNWDHFADVVNYFLDLGANIDQQDRLVKFL